LKNKTAGVDATVLLLGGIIENQNSGCVSLIITNEVRILIFDDPAEQENRQQCRQRPQSGSREGKLSNQGVRAARAMHEFLFVSIQVYSTKYSSGTVIMTVIALQ
jgi:hypothetical protein